MSANRGSSVGSMSRKPPAGKEAVDDPMVSRTILTDGPISILDGPIIEGNEAWMILQAKAPFHITQVSSAWCGLSGYTAEEVVGRSFKLLQGPGTDQLAVGRMLECVQSGQECSVSVITYQKQGRPLVSWFEAKPLFDQGGQVPRFLAKVSYSETVFMKEAYEDANSWALVSLDKTLTITKVSPNLCDLTGFTEASLNTRPFRVLLGPASMEAVLYEEVSACLLGKGSTGSALVTIYSYEARPIVCVVKAQAVLDPKRVLVSHVKVQLERAELLTLEEGMQNTKEAKFIALSKPPHPITYVSPEWSAYYEFTTTEAVSKTIQIFQGQCTDSVMLNEVLGKSTLSSLPQEARLITYSKSGTPLVTSIRLSPLISKSGFIQHFLAQVTIIDNSEEDLVKESIEAESAEYPSTPEGRITHLNGCTHLVLFPREDPTLTHCISYMRHLREAGVVRSWDWHNDALHVHVDTNRVLEYTHSSRWCQQWTPDLRTWHAWWNRMLWVVSKASMTHTTESKFGEGDEDGEDAGSDLSFLAELPSDAENLKETSESIKYSAFVNDKVPQQYSTIIEEDGEEEDEQECAPRQNSTSCDTAQSTFSNSGKDYYQKSLWHMISADIVKELDTVGLDFPVAILDGEGRVVFVNHAHLEQACCEAPQVLGCLWSSILHDDGRGGIGAVRDAIRSREPAAVNVMSRRADGSLFSAYVRVNPCVAIGVPCYSMSVIECGNLFESEAEPEDEEDDLLAVQDEVFRECEKEELDLLQQHAVFKLEHVLQRLSRVYTEAFASPSSTKVSVIYTELVILLDTTDAVLRQCGSMLWKLRELGAVHKWRWDTDSLSVSVNLEALRNHAVQSSWCQLWASNSGCAGKQRLVQMISLLDSHAGGYLRESHEAMLSANAKHATDFRFLVSQESSATASQSGSSSSSSEAEARQRHGGGDFGELEALERRLEGMQAHHLSQMERMQLGQRDLQDQVAQLRRALEEKRAARPAGDAPAAAGSVAVMAELQDALRQQEAQADSHSRQRHEASKCFQDEVDQLQKALAAAGIAAPAPPQARQDRATASAAAAAEPPLAALQAGQAALEQRSANLDDKIADLEDEVMQLRFHQDLLIQQMTFDKLPDEGPPPAAAAAGTGGGGASRPPADAEGGVVPQALVDAFAREVSAAAGGGAACGLSLLDEGGAILWANGPFLATTGFRLADVTGCKWTSFLCGPATEPADVARLEAARRARAADSLCLQCYRETGRPLWLQISQRPAELRARPGDDASAAGPAGDAAARGVFLLSAVDATELFERVVRLGRPMEERRDPELFSESQRLSEMLAQAFAAGEAALAALAGGARPGGRREAPAAPPAAAASAAGASAGGGGGAPGHAGADGGLGATAVVSAQEPWVILEVSPAWERLFEFPDHEARGRSLGVVLGAQGWAAFASAAAAAAAAAADPTAAAAAGSSVAVVARTRGGVRLAVELAVAPAGEGKAAASTLCAVFRPAAAAAGGSAR